MSVQSGSDLSKQQSASAFDPQTNNNDTQITTFDQFWLFYLRAHASPTTRALHFAGLILALSFAAVVIAIDQPIFLLAVPLIGYAFAFSGHYLSEGNHPATFSHPLWSFISYFRMFRYWLMGRLQPELDRAGIVR